MFERYTETARRTVFMGRYEASNAGSPYIETHHLLLGILRADNALASRVFHSQGKIEEVRRRVAQEAPFDKTGADVLVDLPLSGECKRVMKRATLAAERFEQKQVAAEHLLLGIAEEKTSIAARIVLESGVTFGQLEEEARQAGPAVAQTTSGELPEGVRDLVADARAGALTPLIGRERELEQVMRILSRRTKNSVVLLGEPGVGKHAIVCGLAQRIAHDDVTDKFADRRILMIHSWLLAGPRRQAFSQVLEEGDPILYVRGVFDMREGLPEIAGHIADSRRQTITTGGPLSFRLAYERNEELARNFEPIAVLPASEEEATKIVTAVKKQFEAFHDVVISTEAIRTAVAASGRFLRRRVLPERALDLIDDAGALVKMRRHRQRPAIAEREKLLRAITRRLEKAIASHEFEAAQKLSGEEREAREEIVRLAQALEVPEQSNAVSSEDVVEALAVRLSLTVAAVNAALERPEEPAAREHLRQALAAPVPIGRRDWVEGLAAYLADCSPDEAERLFDAMRTAKTKFDRTA